MLQSDSLPTCKINQYWTERGQQELKHYQCFSPLQGPERKPTCYQNYSNFQISNPEILRFYIKIQEEKPYCGTDPWKWKCVLLLGLVVILPPLLHRAPCSLSHNPVWFHLALHRLQVGWYLLQSEVYHLLLHGLMLSWGYHRTCC